jgi:hypothetical protein
MLSWINRLFLTEINISVHPLRWKESKTALICKQRLSLCLPGVILNPVRDDLRMMAPKPVAAKEGGMKQKRNYKRISFIDVNKVMRCWEQIKDLLMTTNPLSLHENNNVYLT